MLEAPIVKRSGLVIIILLALWGKTSIGAEKAAVFGTPTANIRVGPGVEHKIIVTLKENDPVVIEKLEGEWYLVTAADGLKGYMHKSLLKIAEQTEKPAAAPVKTTGSQATETGKAVPEPAVPLPTTQEKAPEPATEPEPAAPPSPTTTPPPANAKSSPAPAKSAALIQMIEGRETETLVCLGVAVLAFLLGWICGGIRALRRDRLKRSRLIF
jgi:uncharacterized protein YgiM (DUF1202 family)